MRSAILGRLSSNKENAIAPPTRRSTKPRLDGVGKAPPHKPKSATIKIRYGRKASVVRAKRVASGFGTGCAKVSTASKTLAPIQANAKPVVTTVAATVQQTAGPTVPTHVIMAIPGLSIRMPIHLPKPNIPPLSHVMLGGQSVPACYVRDRLRPYLHRLYVVATLFAPYPSVPSPPSCSSRSRRSFAFGIPSLIAGAVDSSLTALARGYEPDTCLAIRKFKSNGHFRLVPVTHAVYSSQCSHFPSLPGAEAPSAASHALEQRTSRPITPPTPMSIASDSDASDSDEDMESGYASSSSEVSDIVQSDIGPYRHLPVLSIELPAPDAFEVVHNRLHAPNVKWQPALLQLKPSHCVSAAAVNTILSNLSTFELNNRLRLMHGAWSNMCSLGINDPDMWKELSSAWACVMAVLKERARAAPRWEGPTTL